MADERGPTAESLLTPEDVATWLKVKPAWVRAHANGNRKPELPSLKMGAYRRFRREDIKISRTTEQGSRMINAMINFPIPPPDLKLIGGSMPRARHQNGWVEKTGKKTKTWTGLLVRIRAPRGRLRKAAAAF